MVTALVSVTRTLKGILSVLEDSPVMPWMTVNPIMLIVEMVTFVLLVFVAITPKNVRLCAPGILFKGIESLMMRKMVVSLFLLLLVQHLHHPPPPHPHPQQREGCAQVMRNVSFS